MYNKTSFYKIWGLFMTKVGEKKNVHAGHRARLREQFLINGDNMLEHQLLELMLSYVIPQKDTNPIAHDLINTFGSLAQVVDAPLEELVEINGVSEVVANFLHFESRFVDLYKKSKANNKPILNNTLEIMAYLRQMVELSDVEKFYYMCLDTKNKLICFREMGVGTTKGVSFNNKNFVASVISYKAHTVVICHTHPCGVASPSEQDIALTNGIYHILEEINVKLIDHIIISHDGFFSFFQNKLLGSKSVESKGSKFESTYIDLFDRFD